MRLHARLAAGLFIAALCIAPSAAQATGWVASGPVGPSDAVDPQVAVTAGGDRVIAWSEPGPGGGITVRTAPRGGDFGNARIFPGAFDDTQLGVGADGTVALAWRDNAGRAIHIARRAPGETEFTEATPFVLPTFQPPGTTLSNLGLVVTGGDVFVTFQSSAQTNDAHVSDVWVVRLAAGGSAVQNISFLGDPNRSLEGLSAAPTDPSSINSPQIAVDRGSPVVTWQFQSFATRSGFKGSTQVHFAAWDDIQFRDTVVATIGSTTMAAPPVSPAVAAGGGHAYVGWARPSGRIGIIDMSDSAVTQSLPADFSAPGDLRLGADHSGTLFAAWQGTSDGVAGRVAVGTVVPFGDAPPKAVRLASPGRLDDLSVAADGTAVALLDSSQDPTDQADDVQAAFSSGGNVFGPAEEVSGQQPIAGGRLHQAAAATAPGGRALALSVAFDGLHLSERDSTPPAFGDVTVPATATVGQPVAVAASATDDLSGASIKWDFGDGTRADGPNASHAFATAGDARVTITATDGSGNRVSMTRTVTVQAAAAAIPPSGGIPVPQPVITPSGPGNPPPADRKPPALSRVSLTHTRFKLRAGTTFRLSLSEMATVSIAIARGRTVSGTLTRNNAAAGKLSVGFDGRFGKKALKPGTYTASITATDAAGNRSKAVHVRFTVLKG